MKAPLRALCLLALGAGACASDDASPSESEPPPGAAGEDPGPSGRGDVDGVDAPPRPSVGGADGSTADPGEAEQEDPPQPPEIPECGPEAATPICPRGVCIDGACVEPAACDRIGHCMGDRVCAAGRCVDPCVTHADCGPGEECTDALCGAPPDLECDGDRPCPGRRICDPDLNVCVEPSRCLSDGDCDVTRWGARRCDLDRGVCVYCRGDADCPPGRTCAVDHHAREPICTEAEICQDHGSCLSARRCDTESASCVFEGGCIEDDREPNGSLDQAALNRRSHLTEARYTRLTLCLAGEDWYRVRVPPGRSLQATLRYLAPFDELDVAIWDEGGLKLAEGIGTPNAERVALLGNLPGGGFRYLQVKSRRGGSNYYSLAVDLPECVDDPGEEDDAPEQAQDIASPGGVFEDPDGWICGPDTDWYRLEAPARSVVHVELLHDGSPDDLRLTATARPDAAGAAYEAEATAGGAVVRLEADSRGPRWLSVSGDAGVRRAYRLEITATPRDCDDDTREDNDGRLGASELALGANRLLKACPGDPDWYAIELAAGDGLQVTMATSVEGEPTLALFAPVAGAEPPSLVAAPSPEDGVVRLGRAPQAGRYLLRATSRSPADYRLDVARTPDGFCMNDPLEANDDMGQEAWMEPGVHQLVLCPDDKDRFALHVDEGSVLDVGIRYGTEDNQGLALTVFDPEGRVVGDSADGDGDESVRGLARLSGRYTLRVGRTAGDRDIPYELTAWIEPVNDHCAHPVSLVHGVAVNSSTARARDDFRGACGGSGPDVVYRLDLAQPSGVELRVTPSGDSFNPVVHLRTDCDDVASEVDCRQDAGASGDVSLRAPYLRGGSYYVVVDSADRHRGGNFELSARIVPGGICFPDDHEPDDGPDEAFPVGDGSVDGRTLCAGDEDWLVVDVPEGHDLVVEGRVLGDAAVMDMTLLDAGEVLAGPTALPDSLRLRPDQPGPHLLRLRGGPGEYALHVALVARHAPEDTCQDAPILVADRRVTGDSSALHDFADPLGCGSAPGRPSESPEAVYRLHLDRQSSIKATVTGDFDRVLYLRSECATPESELACVDDWIGPPEVLQHPHLDPGDYFLFIDGFADPRAAGPFEITLDVRDPYFPPENDTCASATPLVPGVELRGTTRLAEDDYSSTCTRRRGHAAADVVYRFSLPSLVRARITLDATDEQGGDAEFDSVLYLRQDCGHETPPIDCIDQPEPQVLEAFLGAGDYYVVVDGWREGEGDFRILLETFEAR